MTKQEQHLFNYILTLGDNAMILGHRLSELCGHGPNLETDIALTNISLDLFGQVRSYFQYAASLLGPDKTEDNIAHDRTEREFVNCILLEQPNTDFAYVICRQFLYDVYHRLILERLVNSADETLAAIASKALKEVKYHQHFSAEWMRRLGGGTEESNRRLQIALDDLYPYTHELFQTLTCETEAEQNGYGINPAVVKEEYELIVREVIDQSDLVINDLPPRFAQGKQGLHSEYMGYILAEFQFMQKTYPNLTW
jgi:ring-1,2-phenylacetyl-CoA epoxidase subunit PaaC